MKKAKSVTPKLRVWHIPQVPGVAFRINVSSVKEALLVLRVLADYDLFQFKHNIKPDYANAQGLEAFEDGEWVEWTNEDGDDIGDVARERQAQERRPKKTTVTHA